MNTTKNKMLGCLYGQAIGDALGLGSEFMSKDEVNKNYPDGLKNYSQIIQDAHRRRWAKGASTDDTEMICVFLEDLRTDNSTFIELHLTSKIGLTEQQWGLAATPIKCCVWETMLSNRRCAQNFGGTYPVNRVRQTGL